MSSVTIRNLTKQFPGRPPTVAVDGVDLEIADGEFVVLLGPSGCGKTTTLRCLAGLEKATSGRIEMDGRAVFDARSGINVPPNQRDIGMVFQSYALWPHMSVRKNIEYPLRARRMREARRSGWVEDAARLVDCESLLDRYPGQLSGGQQQRVALARSLVARPGLVLFDEPLSNLDTRLRDQVRQELHELHARVPFSALFVTHDQAEALALADRLVVMREGRIEQCDTPNAVFHRPKSEYVAGFMGMTNRLLCRRTTDDGWVCGGQPVHNMDRVSVDIRPGQSMVALRIRPDDVTIHEAGADIPAGRTHVDGLLVDLSYGGRHLDAVVEVPDTRVLARVVDPESKHALMALGDQRREVSLSFATKDACVFSVDGSDADGAHLVSDADADPSPAHQAV